MAINIPSFKNPVDSSKPYVNAYGWITYLELDILNGEGRLIVNVHPSEANWTDSPIKRVPIALGEVWNLPNPNVTPPVEFSRCVTLSELMQNPDFAAAYLTIGNILYEAVLGKPEFDGATVIPPTPAE